MCRLPRPDSLRRGMSLAELSLSLAIMTMVAASVGTMSLAVQSVTTYTQGQSNAAQHGRVVLDRIDRTLLAATVSKSFPGFTVVSTSEGSGTFPDALVIWTSSAWYSTAAYSVGDKVTSNGSSYVCTTAHTNQSPTNTSFWRATPATAWSSATAYSVGNVVDLRGSTYVCIAANTNQTPTNTAYWKLSRALPRANELTIIFPNPSNPGSLLEITNPSEPPTATYDSTDQANWRTLVTTLISRSDAVKVELTNLLRTAATSTSPNATRRGCIRFRYSAAPSDTELENYRLGTATWMSLAWPQDLAGKTMGVRSLACFTELQLKSNPDDDAAETALPMFGSSLLWKEVTR